MAVDVRLTNAQALRLCELVGKVEGADYATLEKLGLDGIDLRTLRNAAVRMLVSLDEQITDHAESNPIHKPLFRMLLEQLRQGDHAHNA